LAGQELDARLRRCARRGLELPCCGYQVCEKWLKDRKGRRLGKDDVAHYQKIVVALDEIIRLMVEIDETIEKHGGWPGAFVTDPEKLKNLHSKKA